MATRTVVTAFIAALLTATAASADVTLKARLSGDQEPQGLVVDEDTTGKFQIQFNKDLTEGEYTLLVKSGIRVTQAHLHCGPAGVNGPIIVFLAGFHNLGWDVDGKWVTNATVTDANITDTSCGSTLAQIVESALAGNVYVNVHSVRNPQGATRGQLEGD